MQAYFKTTQKYTHFLSLLHCYSFTKHFRIQKVYEIPILVRSILKGVCGGRRYAVPKNLVTSYTDIKIYFKRCNIYQEHNEHDIKRQISLNVSRARDLLFWTFHHLLDFKRGLLGSKN